MLNAKIKIRPTMPKNNCFRKLIFKLILSNTFEYMIMFIISLNSIFLCIDCYESPPTLSYVIKTGNIIFVSIFALEAVLKLIGFGIRYYFLDTWNIFDFIIVILSLLAADESLFSFKVNVFRIIRVARLLKMVKQSKGLKNLLKALWFSLKNILNVALLMFLIFFTFSVAGMDLFGGI
jgi:voltage-gated sodium channel type V alpha